MGINGLGNPGVVAGAVPGVGPQVPLVPGTPGASVMQPFGPPAVPDLQLTLEEMTALPLVTVVGTGLKARVHAFPVPRSPFAMGPFAMSRPASSVDGDALRRRLNYVGERTYAIAFRVREADLLFHDYNSPLLAAARVFLLPDPLRRLAESDVDELTAVREALKQWPGYKAEVLRHYRPEFIRALNRD